MILCFSRSQGALDDQPLASRSLPLPNRKHRLQRYTRREHKPCIFTLHEERMRYAVARVALKFGLDRAFPVTVLDLREKLSGRESLVRTSTILGLTTAAASTPPTQLHMKLDLITIRIDSRN
ncbi:hypothetical protein D9M68_854770 [compost metagenome]